MNGDELRRLVEQMPAVNNVIGFYHLMYEGDDQTPAQRMECEAHFATSAYQLAIELRSIIEQAFGRMED